MSPSPGERFLRFVGDVLRFELRAAEGSFPRGYRPFLRTNLGRGAEWREEVVRAYQEGREPWGGRGWTSIPLPFEGGRASLDFALTAPGYFDAKICLMNETGRELWPPGPNVTVSVHPSECRTGNTAYCAFARMFGPTRAARHTTDDPLAPQIEKLDKRGYTVIPPSGTLRDLKHQLPHIIEGLGCRILHLLPVNPTPTTYARFGRFGSPYASQDLTEIDPALVEFDRRTTGVDQFRELAYETHRRGGQVILDLVINHTGWGSTLQEKHPDWFLRGDDGAFVSPGAWGVVWEDLVELNHDKTDLWDELAEVFLTWCRRGVDGFRCDAGYKVPMPAWRYITARVHSEFPSAIFLLEGLGGSWEATELLLTQGGMQWAYSELFQNFTGSEVAHYLDYSLGQSARVGLYLHYSETHDNDRLAKRGREWSLLRNRLCALASANGGYGLTCGVEWLADEKLNVHSSRGLSWGDPNHIQAEIRRLTDLLSDHPCFFDGARLTRLSDLDSPIWALSRVSAEGEDSVLALVNTQLDLGHDFVLGEETYARLGRPALDLLGQQPPEITSRDETVAIRLGPGAVYCLASNESPRGLSGERYRKARARAGWALERLGGFFFGEELGALNWRELEEMVDEDPIRFLAAVNACARRRVAGRALTVDELGNAFRDAASYAPVARWRRSDRHRELLVPFGHWVVIEDECPFRASLHRMGEAAGVRRASVEAGGVWMAAFGPFVGEAGDRILRMERYADEDQEIESGLRLLGAEPAKSNALALGLPSRPLDWPVALLTNGRGGMARLCVDLGAVKSKYDCLLGANLHASVPVDRHVFAKRIRAWAVVDGLVSPLNRETLTSFEPGPPARWRFCAPGGDGRLAEVSLSIDLLEGRNTAVVHWRRAPLEQSASGERRFPFRLIARVDLEDRSFHAETLHSPEADRHFTAHTKGIGRGAGFRFRPSSDRELRVTTEGGRYHASVEWTDTPHPVEAARGQAASGAAFSPGWFEWALEPGEEAWLTVCADSEEPSRDELESFARTRLEVRRRHSDAASLPEGDEFGRRLAEATRAFVARRGVGRTVIAGYPWFLDWGRDSLICARGLIAAGWKEEVREILSTFARFEEKGTLPNSIHGEDASNRNTSDAPLWFGLACEEMAASEGAEFYSVTTQETGRRRTILETLRSIALNYLSGTPAGVRVDRESALVWSPTHFTWMDTNFPAGTPREGYPVEIQGLWIRLLRQLERLDARREKEPWKKLADRATESLERFWLPERGYFADSLAAGPGVPAAEAETDDALRCNALFLVSLGLIHGERARRSVDAAARFLVVPGAIRTLAPLRVSRPLPIVSAEGAPLNDPIHPYWGRYEGDEDRRRKPAYHNGTAWTWPFPSFCEALARAWEFEAGAVSAARAYLGSMDRLLDAGCLGHLPEILDGDAPHTQRGCDAQAWGATEALRVWKILNRGKSGNA